MKKTLQILNGIAFGLTVFINYLSNTGAMDGKTIGSISNGIKSLFTPTGYAFSIWGLIYILLLGFSIYQGKSLLIKDKDDDFVNKIGIWFFVSCVSNCCWVFSWIYGYTGISCIFIFLLLYSLLKIIINLNINLHNVNKITFAFLHLPFIIYSGWVTVASVANVSSYLVKINWDGFGVSNETWTIVMIFISAIINLYIVVKRKMYVFSLVGAWALTAIGIANSGKGNAIEPIAFATTLILILITFTHYINNKKPSKTLT